MLDAHDAAASVRRGECSPTELVTEALERIDRVNPLINAVVHRRDERALAEAASSALPDGPFRGVPILVKDAGCDLAGEPTTIGMGVLRDAQYKATVDSGLTRRLRAAGLVIVGRTNVPEMCTAGTTEPVAFGPTRNPWDLQRTAGGSSGGSAAAVAAGIVAVSHGSDGGGSVRMPAACCGVVGLKPSRGRVSAAPRGAGWGGLSTDGPIARTVRDVAALLDVMAGTESGDPYLAPPLPGPLAAEVGVAPPRCRVGLRLAGAGDADPTDPQVAAAIESVARTLEQLGHEVTPAWPDAMDDPDAPTNQGAFVAAEVAFEIGRIADALGRPIGPDELEPWNARLLEIAAGISSVRQVDLREWLTAWSRSLLAWWSGDDAYDVLLTPIITQPPFLLGWMRGDRSTDDMAAMRRHLGWLLGAWNVTGQPAISVPAALTSGGLPVGAQLVAAPGREDLLIRIAAQIEEARPWSAWGVPSAVRQAAVR